MGYETVRSYVVWTGRVHQGEAVPSAWNMVQHTLVACRHMQVPDYMAPRAQQKAPIALMTGRLTTAITQPECDRALVCCQAAGMAFGRAWMMDK